MRTGLAGTRLFPVGLGLAFLGSGMGLWAQSGAKAQEMKGDLIREIHPRPTPTPFPLDAHSRTVPKLEFLAPGEMQEADLALVDANAAEISRRAGLQGFGPVYARTHAEEEIAGKGYWGYEQAVCPVFPNYLILEYSRDNGAGDVTLFSVAIPRGTANGGHVRVIPVRRRSYSLWTPAPSNALTLNDFNHMVTEGGHGVDPDWLTLGLCYAALAGGHVRAALVPGSAAEEVYPLFAPAMLSVSDKGGAEVHLADVTHYPEPHAKAMDWELTFAQNGRLLKVRHSVAQEELERPLPATVEPRAVPVPGAAVDVSKSGN